mmetsp:Transcript_104821/g.291941  ORF Transcript_104821/g.291941 Transcript_104821/m.291941 type:complete len:214 (-) Transcript_104821:207-848(-)|eukprot:CAMPEP_0179158148 /NCGR_PEP_ID=MMETSP0796-20121207/77159_1 /TAXON_ID=73915 /ORGANISM="Pyrodinium bahamense, Strain pbaha01" /LENGTH=213 /DNA_ID=CAMNT_0020859807 /DNA_START=30 /DNA_END=671 /DNA_ORIENTATION=+
MQKVLAEGSRLRLTDFRLAPGEEVSIVHTYPTLRWEVVSGAEACLPPPAFFDTGSSHHARNARDVEYREIVFELVAGSQPRYSEDKIQKLEAAANFNPVIGTGVNFENHLLRAVEIVLPPGTGEADDFHQHTLDYGLVWVGDNMKLGLWHPGADGKAVPEFRNQGIPDGFALFKPMANGGFEEAEGNPVAYAMHSVTNDSEDSWARCYQVEVK